MKATPGIKQLPASRRFPKGGWEVRYRDDLDMTHRKTFSTKEAAQDFQASVRTDKNRGDYIDPRRAQTPFRIVAEEWFAKATTGRKPKTRSGYRYILDAHVLPALGNKPIGKFTPGILEDFLVELGERKASTKRNIFHVLSPIFTRAIRDGYRKDNPASAVELPTTLKKQLNEADVFTAEEVATLADEIGPQYRTLIYFAAYTGMRAGEIVALRVRHLSLMDLNRAKVSVEESVADVSGELHFGPPKNGRTRRLGLPRFLADMLVEQTAGKGRDDFVFPGVRGGPMRHSHFYSAAFKPALRGALPEHKHSLRFHDLRHTAAAMGIAEGEHPKALSDRLGHSSIAVTMDIYGHLYEDHETKTLEGLQERFERAITAKEAQVVTMR